jgi:hypothetical protein
MKYRKWTEDDKTYIIELLKLKYTYSQIAHLTKRTPDSIRNQLFKLGFNFNNEQKVTKLCKNCNSTFIVTPKSRKIFCSHSCSGSFYNKKKTKKCIFCDNFVKLNKNKYCSNSCSAKHTQSLRFNKIEQGDGNFCIKTIKNFLIDKFGNKCMKCGWCEINQRTQIIPIQIDHIDGNSENNNLSNLRLLCPNCHSLTPTYGGANKGRGRKKRYD